MLKILFLRENNSEKKGQLLELITEVKKSKKWKILGYKDVLDTLVGWVG